MNFDLAIFFLVDFADFQWRVEFITLKPGISLSLTKNITTIKFCEMMIILDLL